MKKVILGNTGQLVSELCLGTMYFGTKVDRLQSENILNHYCDTGGNFIDTSNNYSFWWEGGTGNESEELIGQWLKERKRDDVIIATKCGARPTAYHGDLESIQLDGLSYDTIIKSVEDSLKRLDTDYIDILYAHIDFHDCDFRGLDLRGLDTKKIMFRGAYFRGADLRGIDFSHCDMHGVSLASAQISGCLFPSNIDATEIFMSVEKGIRMRAK